LEYNYYGNNSGKVTPVKYIKVSDTDFLNIDVCIGGSTTIILEDRYEEIINQDFSLFDVYPFNRKLIVTSKTNKSIVSRLNILSNGMVHSIFLRNLHCSSMKELKKPIALVLTK
jgi:hypothetical protein